MKLFDFAFGDLVTPVDKRKLKFIVKEANVLKKEVQKQYLEPKLRKEINELFREVAVYRAITNKKMKCIQDLIQRLYIVEAGAVKLGKLYDEFVGGEE